MSSVTPLLVLGLGNVLLQDDGVGAAAVALLVDGYDVPAGVRVVDGGTLGLSLLPYIEDADNVILVDAIRTDAPAGTLVRLDGADVLPAVATRLSPHQVGVLDLLDGARWRGRYPLHIVLAGIVPGGFDLSLGLSEVVAATLPNLVKMVVGEAEQLGFPFTHRVPAPALPIDGTLDLARLAARSAVRRRNGSVQRVSRRAGQSGRH